MANPKILDLSRNTESIASCAACGKTCYEFDHSGGGRGELKLSKPGLLVTLRVGRGSHATIIRFCDPCLAELGWRITTVISVPEARR